MGNGRAKCLRPSDAVSAIEAWLICRFIGVPVPWRLAFAIEVLSIGIDAVLLVPGKVGTQEGGKTAVFVADLMPTTAHLGEAWIMGYDLYPMDTLAAKKAFLKEAIARDMLVFFEHDPVVAAGRIKEQNGRRTVAAEG